MGAWITEKTKKSIKEMEELDIISQAYHNLWVCVILQAVKDYKKCNPNSYSEAQAYSYYSAKTFLSQDWIWDSLGIAMSGKECLRVLDGKSWKDLKKIFGDNKNDDEEEE